MAIESDSTRLGRYVQIQEIECDHTVLLLTPTSWMVERKADIADMFRVDRLRVVFERALSKGLVD
jgi:hypothetical protein